MNPASTIAGKIMEEYLAEQNLTRAEFAARLGISPAYLTMLMTGKRNLSPTVISLLAKRTGIAIEKWNAPTEARRSVGPRSGAILTGAQIADAHTKGWITIDPFFPDPKDGRLQAASYDLTRGSFCYAGSKEESDGLLVLRPGEAAMVHVCESITVSKFLTARIAAMSHLVLEFIRLDFGLHLDPGWSNPPFVTLHNYGKDVYRLEPDHLFASVEFLLLAEESETGWAPRKKPLVRMGGFDVEGRITTLEKELAELRALQAARGGVGQS